jgi:AraC-like DNA-binding protein
VTVRHRDIAMVLLDHGGRHPSEVELMAPPPDLEWLVQHLWVQGSHGSVTDWRVVADTAPHLIASVTESGPARRLRVQLVGGRTHAATVDVTNRVLTVGVRLRVGVLPGLTGESASAFVDRGVPIGDVFSGATVADLELGDDAPSTVIARELVRLMRRLRRHEVRPLIPVSSTKIDTVRGLAEWLNTAPRSLRDRVHHEAGLSPKRLLRVLRLHAALRAAWKDDVPWSAVAYLAGYADQAHLTREVRALLGEAPSAWRARGSAVLFKTSPCERR